MHKHLTHLLTGTLLVSGLACGDDVVEPPDPDLTITTSSLPGGSEGMDYQVEVTASGGTNLDYRWSLADGGLPTGVFLRSEGTPSTVLAGVPRSGGTSTFTLRVRDSAGNEATADLQIDIEAAPPSVDITTSMLPMGSITQSYTATISAENGQGYSWRLLSGQLPPGLTLSEMGTPSTTLSGTPTAVGRYSFTIRVKDADGNRDEEQYSVEVVDDRPELEVLPARLPDATVSVAYTFDFVARGGSLRGYEWSIVSGELPPGLTLAEEGTPNATLSGTPTERGSYAFRVEVRDDEGEGARESYFIEVAPAPDPLRIVTFELPKGRVAESYSTALRAVNGSQSGYTWSIAQGNLPGGLSLTSGTPEATLSGTPTESGSFELLVRVEDSIGSRNEQLFTLDIAEEIIPVSITATAAQNGVLVLPNAEGGQPYDATIQAANGAPLPANAGSAEVRYNWVVTGGSLPPGLSLQTAGQGPNDEGSFSGVPSALGVYTATVTVYDRMNQTDSQIIQITVDPPSTPLTVTTSSLEDLPAAGCYSETITAAGGGNSGFTWRISSGNLPPGVTIESAGTPSTQLGGFSDSATGTYTFTVEVTDSFGLVATRQLTLTVDPNGQGAERWAVYVADQDIDNQFDVYAEDLCDRSTISPTRVNPTNSSGDVSTSRNDVKLSPAGNALAFIGDLTTTGQEEVYVVDLRNGAQTGEATRILDAASSTREAIDLRWSPDGSKIAIRYDGSSSGHDELWVADVSNLGAPQQAVQVSHSGTSSFEDVYDEYGFSPDGRWVAWVGDSRRSNFDEIFAVDVSGATPGAIQDCTPPGNTSSLEVYQRGFIWTPDSRGVVFTADITDSFDPDLYFCDLSGASPSVSGFPNTLNRPDTEGNSSMENEDHLSFSASGDRMFYIADVTGSFEYDLFVVSYDSTTGTFSSPTNITRISASSGEVRSAKWADTGYRIIVQGDLNSSSREEVFVFDGSPTASAGQTKTPLKSTNGSTFLEASTNSLDYGLSPDGTKAVFIGDFDQSGADELWYVDVSGGAPYTDFQLNRDHTSSRNDVQEFAFLGDGSGIVFTADTVSSNDELWYVDLSGAVPTRAERLHSTLSSGQDVFDAYTLSVGRTVLFRGDAVTSGVTGAYQVEIGEDGQPGELEVLTGSALSGNRDVNLLLVR